ncbi:MAG: leucyl/phenylalanyl-tRNA--protein transferase [Pyrinomonadaceae bacterium]|nr:leucyl/phenylalanyl-tRNA--protein transferase [Pyrinomonadaceae bacterium]MBP6212354.1 leucyl/phenylalanyl-tRNA--protein transferase [Pyrinomonadaceae bacterium]
MSLIEFPDPRDFDYHEWVIVGDYMYPADGVVHFGGKLSVDNLQRAYRMGIFPWHTDGIPLPWHCPDPRAILDFADLYVPRSLAKLRRRGDLTFTINEAFALVIDACSRAFRPGQRGTWITGEFADVYCSLHEAGIAHSVEAWDSDGQLAGGLYGVDAGGVFCGESMFFIKPNASKLALLHLIDHLRSRGSTWLDAQVMTPHMDALGAKEIDRGEFLDKLKATQEKGLTLF